jgi:hypothetical protein
MPVEDENVTPDLDESALLELAKPRVEPLTLGRVDAQATHEHGAKLGAAEGHVPPPINRVVDERPDRSCLCGRVVEGRDTFQAVELREVAHADLRSSMLSISRSGMPA